MDVHPGSVEVMKIAIDIRETLGAKTGKGWYTWIMVKQLLERNLDHEYLLYTHESNPDFENYPKVRQRVISKTGLGWHWAVSRNLRREKPDVFWAPTSYIIPALAPAGLKVIVTVHDIVAFLFPEGHNKKAVWLERLTLHRAIRKSEHVLTVSRSTKDDLTKLFQVPIEKSTITPCAANTTFGVISDLVTLRHVREKYKLPERFILAVGTLSPRKNFHRLIQAYAQVMLKHQDTDLVIVGPKGWNFENIVQFEGTERVHLLGYVDGSDLAALYNLASLFVFPSLYEGFGIPPLEAMACGCPVITSNTSSLPEVVGNAAMLVDPYAVDEIVTAMDIVLSNPYIAHDLRQKGFERAKKFQWEESAAQVLEALEAAKSKTA